MPPEGLDAPKRIIFYRMVISSSGDVDSGPRASQYATPYPLDTKELRKAYSENNEVQVSDTFTVSVLPNLPEMGYRIVREDAPPMRMLPPSGDGEMPPASVNATCDGNDCTNQPPTHVEPTPPGRDVEPEASTSASRWVNLPKTSFPATFGLLSRSRHLFRLRPLAFSVRNLSLL